jgi:hypothetical protein
VPDDGPGLVRGGDLGSQARFLVVGGDQAEGGVGQAGLGEEAPGWVVVQAGRVKAGDAAGGVGVGSGDADGVVVGRVGVVAQWHEDGAGGQQRARCGAVGVDGEQCQCAAHERATQVDHDPSAGAGLGDPGIRDPWDRAGGDDPVIGGMVADSGDAVGGHQMRPVAVGGQSPAGGGHQPGVDVDAGDVGVAESFGEQGGVVAGAGADL